jgi:hypothetical protein
VTLQLRSAPGEVTRWKYAIEITSSSTGAIKIASHSTQECVFQQVVQSTAADGAHTAQMTLLSVHLVSDQGAGRKSVYDSATDGPMPKDPMARPYAAMLGLTLTLVEDAEGHLKSVDGMDAMFDRLAASYDDDPKESEFMKSSLQAMKGSFGKQMFQPIVDAQSDFLPASPVRVGDTWTRDRSIAFPIVGRQDFKSRYRLESVDGPPDDRIATISSTSTATPVAAKQGDPASPFPSLPTPQFGKSTSTGKYVFSINQGRMVRLESEHKGSMTTTMPGRDGKEDKMTMESSSKMTLELLPGQ